MFTPGLSGNIVCLDLFLFSFSPSFFIFLKLMSDDKIRVSDVYTNT